VAHLGVLSVTLRDSQRREYLADQRSAQLAGAHNAARLLDLLCTDADAVVAARARAQQLNPAWREAAAQLVAPERAAKVRRLRQLSTRTDVSLWTTHPPAGLRAWLVEAMPAYPPTLVLSEADSTLIDNELASYYQRARRDLAQSGV
jgi:Zn-dependent protease with chaperone function